MLLRSTRMLVDDVVHDYLLLRREHLGKRRPALVREHVQRAVALAHHAGIVEVAHLEDEGDVADRVALVGGYVVGRDDSQLKASVSEQGVQTEEARVL
jgi:hypothetical protein